jgi:meiotically up-regulated gene 157 (Mug157) protein
MQFIASCHKAEDNFASKYSLDMDNLFMFMNLMRVDLDENKNKIVLAEHLKKSYDHLFDVFQIEKGNLDDYQYRFERIGKFISRDL